MKSMMIICLVICVIMSVPHVFADESNSLSLDDRTLQRVSMRQRREANGFLVFRYVDSETQEDIDSVDVYRKISSGKYTRSMGDWLPGWLAPDFYTFKIELSGYMSIFIRRLRVPTDSAVIVTIQMKKGDGVINSSNFGDSLVQIDVVTLDGTFPKNEIVGKIIDDSSGLPVSGATVFCEQTSQTVSTDSLGEFTIGINLLKSVTLNAWHPLYDSIRFEVTKNYVRTQKEIEIHFQTQRRSQSGEKVGNYGDDDILLLVDMMDWGRMIGPREFKDIVYTYSVEPGEVFGPTSRWTYYDCIPFRLIKNIKDEAAWIQFTHSFGLAGEDWHNRTNLVFVSDTAVKLGTKSVDGGTTVTLSLQPDYSPRGMIRKRDYSKPRRRIDHNEKRKVNSCDVLRAAVERIHILNMLAYLDGDFARYAKAFSDSYKLRDNRKGWSLEEYLKIYFGGKYPEELRDKRLFEIFNLPSSEMYVHGICSNPANERFVKLNERSGFVPLDGDVYIYWPLASISRDWGWNLSIVYRKENGNWKIVEMYQ